MMKQSLALAVLLFFAPMVAEICAVEKPSLNAVSILADDKINRDEAELANP